MDGLDGLAQALGITDRKDADWHVLAKVSAVNPDGSLTVYMAGSLNPTTVDAYCDAQAGDVVCVMISKGKARAIARRGGFDASGLMPKPDVLYNNPTGGSGTLTLSRSIADYDHMRIYYGFDVYARSSVDVYDPNGKQVNLLIQQSYDATYQTIQSSSAVASGSTITMGSPAKFEINFSAGALYGFAQSNSIKIYRVEAWNEG